MIYKDKIAMTILYQNTDLFLGSNRSIGGHIRTVALDPTASIKIRYLMDPTRNIEYWI